MYDHFDRIRGSSSACVKGNKNAEMSWNWDLTSMELMVNGWFSSLTEID